MNFDAMMELDELLAGETLACPCSRTGEVSACTTTG